MKKNALMGRLALFLTTIIWGTSFVVLKSTLDEAPVLWVLAIRFIGAALLLALISFKKLREINRDTVKAGMLMGLMLFLAYIFQTYGLAGTTPGKNAFLTAVYCVIVPFLNWFVHKRRPDGYNITAAVCCLAGVGFVSLTGDLTIAMGDALTLVGGLCFALHILATDKGLEKHSTILLSFIQMATAGILGLISAIFFEPFPTQVSSGTLWSIAYLCVMCTALCFFLQTFGQKHTPPAAAAVIMTFESVFGAMISALLGQDQLTFRLVFGFLLIFVAVIISETKLSFLRKKPAAKS